MRGEKLSSHYNFNFIIMKKYSLLILFLSLLSFGQSKTEFIDYEYNAQKSDQLINNKYIKVNLNGETYLFLFDTGAANTVITKSEVTQKLEKTNDTKIKSATGKKIKLNLLKAKKLSTNMVSSKNRMIFGYEKNINFTSNTCNNENKEIQGVLSSKFYTDAEIPYLLDYENGEIKLLENFNPADFKDYVAVDAKFKGIFKRFFYLNMKINGKKRSFIFDTGAIETSILLKKEGNKNISTPSTLSFLSLGKTGDGQSTFEIDLSIDNAIEWGNFKFKTEIIQPKNVPFDIVGLGFISKFNWIIDRENKKVYAKKIKELETKKLYRVFSNTQYLTSNLNGKLIISSKLKNAPIKLGSEIIAVNGTSITSENICEMQTLLTKTKDWNTLKIEIKH